MEYNCTSPQVAEYLRTRWERLPEQAKRLLNLDMDEQMAMLVFLTWEVQYWRAKEEYGRR